MRRFLRRAVAAPIVVIGAIAISNIAFAGTISTPNTSPFNVPGDSSGNPVAFTIVASGYQPDSLVSVEQCDGTPSTAVGWSPTINCDLGSAPAQAIVDSSGNATFPANDPNRAFTPFKGESPQSLFNCIAPGEPAPGNGLPTFTNCQVRVASSLTESTADQAFLTMVLPTALPTCGMGEGIPNNNPSKPPKNAGLAKLNKSLLPDADTKTRKWKLTGTLEDCVNLPTWPKTGTPLIAGSMQLQVELPPGSTCTNLVPGAPVKGQLQVKWSAIDPGNGKLKNVVTDKFKTIVSFTRAGGGLPITIDATSPVIPVDAKSKSVFQGKRFALHFVFDETQAEIDALCPGPKGKGIKEFHFTNEMGQSSLVVLD